MLWWAEPQIVSMRPPITTTTASSAPAATHTAAAAAAVNAVAAGTAFAARVSVAAPPTGLPSCAASGDAAVAGVRVLPAVQVAWQH